MGFFSNLFKSAPKVDLAELVKNGATIVDVRTKEEYKGGHVKGSINIPLNVVGLSASKLNKDKPIITCCASGMRSGSAKSILKSQGFEVYNGGSWMSVNNQIKK